MARFFNFLLFFCATQSWAAEIILPARVQVSKALPGEKGHVFGKLLLKISPGETLGLEKQELLFAWTGASTLRITSMAIWVNGSPITHPRDLLLMPGKEEGTVHTLTYTQAGRDLEGALVEGVLRGDLPIDAEEGRRITVGIPPGNETPVVGHEGQITIIEEAKTPLEISPRWDTCGPWDPFSP